MIKKWVKCSICGYQNYIIPNERFTCRGCGKHQYDMKPIVKIMEKAINKLTNKGQ